MEIFKSLGINRETTPDHLTLGEIGLESMFAIELQQELEREFKLKITKKQLKSINIGLLKQYCDDNVELTRSFILQLQNAREKLASYKFIMPSEPITKLNNVNKGKPIYFLPPMEITFSAYEEFVKKFDRPVIGFNWTRDVSKFVSMKEINQYFTNLLKKLEPKSDYDLVGCLDGAIVVAKQVMNGKLNKGIIIDMFGKEEGKVLEQSVSDDIILRFFFNFIAHELPESFATRISRNIFEGNDTTDRISRIVYEFKEFVGSSAVAQDMEEIITIGLRRVKIR